MDKEDYTKISFEVLIPKRLKWGVIADLNYIVSKRIGANRGKGGIMDKEDYTKISFEVLIPSRLKWGVIADLNDIVSKRIDVEDFSITVEHKNG